MLGGNNAADDNGDDHDDYAHESSPRRRLSLFNGSLSPPAGREVSSSGGRTGETLFILNHTKVISPQDCLGFQRTLINKIII